MPLGDATSIFLTSPLWAALLGRIVLGERLSPVDALAIGLAICGVVLVARPTALFGAGDGAGDAGDATSHPAAGGGHGAYVVLSGAVFAGSVAVLVRLLRRLGVHQPAVVAHAYALITMAVAPVGMAVLPHQGFTLGVGGGALAAPARTWLLALLIGVLAVPNQLLVNAGLMRTPAALGSMMRLIDVPCAFALQLAVFGEAPHGSSVVGALLIVLCTAGSAYRKWRQGAAAAAGGSGGKGGEGGGGEAGGGEGGGGDGSKGGGAGGEAAGARAAAALTHEASGRTWQRWAAPLAFGRLREEATFGGAAVSMTRT